jgi:recombination protein RecT
MSTNALKTAVTGVTTTEKPTDIFGMLKVWAPEIERALPRHMNVDRMTRIAMTEIRRNEELGRCKPVSLFAAVISAAQMGLEIGMGRCFLVPYKDECQLIPGWKGMVELANRSGRSACWTGAVFEGDQFVYQMGDSPFVKHIPMGEDDPKKITHVYAVGRVKGSDWPVIEVWPIAKVWKHRDRYNRQGAKHYSFREPEMYARKIPLLQVLKYLPSSPELEAALVLANTEGDQHLTLEGVITNGSEVHITDERPSNIDDDGVVTMSFAKVAEMINNAETADVLDLAEQMIANVEDEAQRAELDVAARAKRKTLK